MGERPCDVFLFRCAGKLFAVLTRDDDVLVWPVSSVALRGFDGEMWTWEEDWPFI